MKNLEATNKDLKIQRKELVKSMEALRISDDDKEHKCKVDEVTLFSLINTKIKDLQFGVPQTKIPQIQISVSQSVDKHLFDINEIFEVEHKKESTRFPSLPKRIICQNLYSIDKLILLVGNFVCLFFLFFIACNTS